MAKKQGVVSFNITLPIQVRKQMRKRADVNWSQVAKAAFEKVLQERSYNMSQVAERLRKSRDEHASEQQTEGIEEGKKWAAKQAELHELKNFARMDTECPLDSADGGLIYDDRDGDAYSLAERIACQALNGTMEPSDCETFNRSQAEAYWERIGGDGFNPDAEFVVGFVEGCLSVFEAVKNEL
jgi:hypothetical protein